MASDIQDLLPMMEKIGHKFSDPLLLQLALTHKSFRNEQPSLAPRGDNERLEFLGDAVLDLVLSECLMNRFALDQEGSLSRKRASLVNEEQLAGLARDLGLLEYIRLGKGERQSGGPTKPRILASTLEAIFGAVFIDAGYSAAAEVVIRLYEPLVCVFEKDGVADFARDYKTRLQEIAQERFRLTPTYHLEAHSGPDHARTFEVSVRLEARVLGVGSGRNKKTAEQDAARCALQEIEAPPKSIETPMGETPDRQLTERKTPDNQLTACETPTNIRTPEVSGESTEQESDG